MAPKKFQASSGVNQLDQLLNGLYIGDNVIWYDAAGSLASVFCLNFIQSSLKHDKPLIYVCFDRSPRNLVDRLGPLARNSRLTILDCFTHGKGAGADIFLDFYRNKKELKRLCKIICVAEPRKVSQVTDAFYGVHSTLKGDVRFVFESLTGMQELWEGEEHLVSFYSHSCPRLYELNTIAYWVIEKEAHSSRLKAQINQIAQVAIDLSVRRGKTSLTILKAEKREPKRLNRPYHYWSKDLNVMFDSDTNSSSEINLGIRVKALRTKKSLSQTELAKLVGVTPSTISQVESNLIYPSLPALFKMAEVLAVDVSSFFQEVRDNAPQIIFPITDASEIQFPNLPKGSVRARLLTSAERVPKAEPYLIEILPRKNLSEHFFYHKGEEMGYLLSGKLQLKIENTSYTINPGDMVCLTTEIPSQWKNPGPEPARLLWFKIK